MIDKNLTNLDRAEILTQALPYFKKYHDEIVVVKYGGNAMVSEDLKQQVMEDVVLLHLIGVKVVLVHGGGPEITDTLNRLGKESQFVDGLRVTDKETADVVQMVLAGKINKSLVNLIQINGGKAIGLSGLDGHMIEAETKDERLGFVGKITKVDVTPILDILEKGYIPVVSTIGCDNKGNVYNINADTAAAFIAGAMNAKRLISMTDIAGVLQDKDDPDSIIKCINIEDANQLFDTGVISGGMIPKVECCIQAIKKGVSKVVIMDGRVPHSILIELFTDEGTGTMVTA
ncbi:MAG: acetylglutamate kinase [Clostridia bacterium]|jgi:acetylglutamate kinase|nr:acetylglutamate kinase [Clostridia bacterium]